MKKITLLLAVTLFSTMAMSQLGFGIKGAVTMSNLTTDIQEIEEAAQTGWQLGAYLRIGDKWHLQPEVYFTAKPGSLTYSYSDLNDPMQTGKVTQDITLNTIDIPLLIGYKIIDPPTLNVRLQAGPVLSMVANKTFNVSSEGVDPPELTDSYENSYSDINWGLQFGAGVDFLFLTADLRYEMGLSNLYENDLDGVNNIGGAFKNNVFMLSVGIKIL